MRAYRQSQWLYLGVGMLALGLLAFHGSARAAKNTNEPVFAADETVRLAGPGQIHMLVCRLSNTDIRIVAENRKDVAPVLVKHGTGGSRRLAREDARDIKTQIQKKNDVLELAIDGSGAGRDQQPTLVLHLPRGMALDLEDINAAVTCLGPLRNVKIKDSNGKLTVKGASGTLDLTTSSDMLDIEADQAVVNAVNSNGKIRFQGRLAPGQQIFTTTNESISLRLPPDSKFELKAETTNGNISSDFALDTIQQDSNTLHATFGDKPDALIALHTSNSNIKVKTLGQAMTDE